MTSPFSPPSRSHYSTHSESHGDGYSSAGTPPVAPSPTIQVLSSRPSPDLHVIAKPKPELSFSRTLAVIAICTSAFVVSNSTALAANVLVPIIQRELNIEASDLQWISSGFPLGFGSCLLLLGRLADVYGHKLFIQLGTIFFSLSSLGCALSRSSIQLSIFRVLQGVGAAATAPSLIGVLGNNLDPGTPLKRVGFASLSAGAPLGGAVGLLVGGFITQGTRPSWRSFFYLCTAASASVCACATVIIPADRRQPGGPGSRRTKQIDWLGGGLIISGLVLLTFSLGTSSRLGWRTPAVFVPFPLSLVLLIAFGVWQRVLEKRIQQAQVAAAEGKETRECIEPVLKLDIFRRGVFVFVLLVAALLWFGFVVQNFFFHQYLQDYLRLGLTAAVIRFIPMLVVGVLLNISMGFLSHVIPAQALMILGCAGTAASCLLSALMQTSASYWKYNFASIALSVIGPDFVFATGTMYGSQISSKSEQAVTGGTFHTFAQMGNAIGLSVATLIQIQVTRTRSREEGVFVTDDLTVAPPDAFLSGLRAGFWTCFASVALATLVSLVFLRHMGYVGRKESENKDKARYSGSSQKTLAAHGASALENGLEKP